MKVYLVDVDNGESYEDYMHGIRAVFTTYRGASEWLIDKGYEPYYYIDYENKDDVRFYWQESDEYMADRSNATIIEMEVRE